MIVQKLKSHPESFAIETFQLIKYLFAKLEVFLKRRLLFNSFYCLFSLQTKLLGVKNILTMQSCSVNFSGCYFLIGGSLHTGFFICMTVYAGFMVQPPITLPNPKFQLCILLQNKPRRENHRVYFMLIPSSHVTMTPQVKNICSENLLTFHVNGKINLC